MERQVQVRNLIAQSIHNHRFKKGQSFYCTKLFSNTINIRRKYYSLVLQRGSFTGAENKMGIFEMADGGTLVLDEINSMDINLQPKLLRAR